MKYECQNESCKCESSDENPMSNPMNSIHDDIIGGTHIGNSVEKEPELTEFAKTAIAIKMEIHQNMEKPEEGASWKEIVKRDNAYIKECKSAMQELRENWIGDENQVQKSTPIEPKGDCCCFTCLKNARKEIDFHPSKLPVPFENVLRQAKTDSEDENPESPLVDSDSEE